jgi:hypothetical protein
MPHSFRAVAAFALFAVSPCMVSSQSLSINTDGSTADASAMLDIKSTVKGLLIPRMTTAQRTAIASPATGLEVYDTDLAQFYYYNGTVWTALSTTNGSWSTTGNSGTNPTGNFLGTTDNFALAFRTNNSERMRITTLGEVGIGTSTPNSTYGTARLELASEGTSAPIDLLIRNAANSNGYAAGYVIQHARGTLANPLAVANGDYLGAATYSMNYDGTTYLLSAAINIYADGAISTGKVPTRFDFNTVDTGGAYATRMVVKNDGKVGIGTSGPNSTLQVNGTLAVGVTMNIAGGDIGSPTLITTQKSYLGLSPSGTNIYYRLPDPASYPGRIYYIRNNDNSISAWIGTVSGVICPGSSTCLSSGVYYELKATVSVKSVMAISDGTNWSVFKLD